MILSPRNVGSLAVVAQKDIATIPPVRTSSVNHETLSSNAIASKVNQPITVISTDSDLKTTVMEQMGDKSKSYIFLFSGLQQQARFCFVNVTVTQFVNVNCL